MEGSVPKHFGPYRLLAELGRGGQGVVWLAEDPKLNRKVALKVMDVGVAPGSLSDMVVSRFRREAEAASRLDHPNICTLLDMGEVDGVPFLAFQFVQGETLAARISRAQERVSSGSASAATFEAGPTTRDGVHGLCATFEKIALALHKAHEAGLIHRDVKPGNIMVTEDGEPIILDFGLARDEIGDDHGLTQSGDLLGTPAYMSPEQLMAQRIPLDRRTDVYSLGASLYEMLTLKRPFEAVNRAELYQRIMTHEPSSATSLNRAIPRDLQVVLATALEKDRDRRYQSAQGFAEDLRRIRRFEPILAKPIGPFLKIRRWAQRHPALAASGIAIVASLVLGLMLTLRHVTELRALALAHASTRTADKDQLLALLLAREAVNLRSTPETRSALYAAMAAAHERRRWTHPAGVNSVVGSPDGRHFLTACTDGKARVFEMGKDDPVEFYEGDRRINFATFSRDSKLVATAQGRTVFLWKRGAETWFQNLESTHRGHVTWIDFSEDGKHLATTSFDGTTRVWDVGSGKELEKERVDHGSIANSVEFSEDGRQFVTTSFDGVIKIKEFPEGAIRRIPIGVTVNHARFLDASGDRILASSADLSARILDARTGRTEVTLRSHQGSAFFATPSPDGAWIVTTSSDQTVRVFDSSGHLAAVFRGHRDVVTHAVFLEDAVVTSSRDGTVRVWGLDAPGFPVLRGHTHLVRSAEFDSNGDRVVTSSGDGTVRIWDSNGQSGPSNIGFQHPRNSVFETDQRVISVSESLRTISWNTTDHGDTIEIRPKLPFPPENVRDLEIRGEWIAINVGRTAEIRDRHNGKLRHVLSHDGLVNSVSWSPDGESLVTATVNGSVWLWNTTTGEGSELVVHGRNARSACFSPNGQRLLTSSTDGTARVWTREGEIVHSLVGHEGAVLSATWSPRGDRVLTVSRDRTARLWDPASGEHVVTLRGHTAQVWRGAFSPKGDRVVTASWDRTARIWPVYIEPVLQAANRRLASVRFPRKDLLQFADLLGGRIHEFVTLDPE